MWSHAGAFSTGARTLVLLLPEQRLGITVLANAFPTGFPEGVANTFVDLVMNGESTRDWAAEWGAIFESITEPANKRQKTMFTPPSKPLPGLPAEAYMGTYSNAYVGEALVEIEDGQLVVRLGPDGIRRLPLVHFNRDHFVYYPSDEFPDVPFGVSFEIGLGGCADRINFSDLDDLGLGTLARTAD